LEDNEALTGDPVSRCFDVFLKRYGGQITEEQLIELCGYLRISVFKDGFGVYHCPVASRAQLSPEGRQDMISVYCKGTAHIPDDPDLVRSLIGFFNALFGVLAVRDASRE